MWGYPTLTLIILSALNIAIAKMIRYPSSCLCYQDFISNWNICINSYPPERDSYI